MNVQKVIYNNINSTKQNNQPKINNNKALSFGNYNPIVTNAVSKKTWGLVEEVTKKMLTNEVKTLKTKAKDGTLLTIRNVENGFFNLSAKNGIFSTHVILNEHFMCILKSTGPKARIERYKTIGGIGIMNNDVQAYLNNFLVETIEPPKNKFLNFMKLVLDKITLK